MGTNVTIKSYRKEREKEIIDGLEKSLEKVGAIVERQAKINIIQNSSKSPWKKTGQLASSVVHQLVDNNTAVEIGIKRGENAEGTSIAKIGRWLELGHSQHPGQYVPAIGKRLVASDVPPYPWLFPALEVNRQKIIDILKSAGAKNVSFEVG